METTIATNSAEPLTFEKVWAMFQESGKRHDEDFKRHKEQFEEESRRLSESLEKTQQELSESLEKTKQGLSESLKKTQQGLSESLEKTKQELSESLKKTQQVVAESLQETDRLVSDLSKNVGGLNRSMGELIETLIAARLWEKFSGYPYNLKRAYQRIPIYDEKNYALAEIDILLVDTEWAMVVEVKQKLRESDIEHHTKRMERIVKYPPAEAKGKKLLGALAAGVVSPEARDLAYSNGYFVLELTGESVALIPPPEGFKPAELPV
jgi:predicted AAA+ superfamily ATPase